MSKFFAILFCLICLAASAQKKLSGKILIEGTNAPAPAASIFLANTSVGTTSDDKGNFSLQVPEGKFDFVVTLLGYETHHTTIQSDQLPQQLVVTLKPQMQELQEVVVESYDQNGWDKWGKLFLDNFIGASEFASQCKLLNKEVLRFRMGKKTNTLRVTATDQLRIENNALGYLLRYDLSRFELNMDTQEFLYLGFPFFEEMKASRPAAQKRWIENRQNAYEGSLMHFMRSLFQNLIQEQKFEVRQWVSVSPEERARVKAIWPRQSKKVVSKRTAVTLDNGRSLYVDEKDTANLIHPDSLNYYRSIISQIENPEILVNVLLSAKDISSHTNGGNAVLAPNQHLQIIYLPKRVPPEYWPYIPKHAVSNSITSEAQQLMGQPVYVYANGSFFDGINLSVTGHWAWWEKACNKLPYDYQPPATTIR